MGAKLYIGTQEITPVLKTETVKNQDKTVTANGTYTADTGYTGLGTVTVNVPTSKQYTTELVFKLPDSVTSITEDEKYYCGFFGYNPDSEYTGAVKSISIDLNKLQSISGNNVFHYFLSMYITASSINIPTMIVSGSEVFNNFARRGRNDNTIGDITIGEVECTSSAEYAFISAFSQRTITGNVVLGFKKLLGSSCCRSMFDISTFTNTVVSFPNLDEIGEYALLRCFSATNITSLSFPALKSTSFGSYTNCFYGMLSNCENVTVHFPSNLQSVIGQWEDVVGGFGGTNTQVLFDLPATE